MSALHLAGVLLLPLCGWLLGDAVQARMNARLAALQQVTQLLLRIRQEIAFRRADLQSLLMQLGREGVLPALFAGGTLQALPAPADLTKAEQQCFRECMEGLGRTEAAQECERLDYYLARFAEFRQQALHTAQAQAGLPHRLGLAVGTMLALVLF